MKIKTSDFISQRVRCGADLYLPENVNTPPVVIMAHGMAGQKNFRLPAYARRFVEKNMGVFIFDYRTFGESDGTPRQIVDPRHQLADWQAAIAHVRTLTDVDGSRIALWGSSLSGGHVIVCASEDDDISAVVTQVPYVSSFSSLRMKSVKDIVLSSVYGVYDLVRAVLCLSPHYSPAVGRPGVFAALNTEESYPGYMSIAGDDLTWENKIASRGFLKMARYNPIQKAGKVNAPVLVMAARYDSLIPVDAVVTLSENLPKGELVVVDCNHFAPYSGAFFEQFSEVQGSFLAKQLKVGSC
ncbi:MAG: alpha/beta fold hydrolase [Desulfobacterium sp.]|nr:alpha/beta fold hydrolase [Desulfobacterium sp.]